MSTFLKESSLSFIFFRILALSYFPNTIPSNTQDPTTPQYEIKSQYRVFSQKQSWISQILIIKQFECNCKP